jgi:hypothetical protein
MPPVFRQGHDQPRCQDPAWRHPVRSDTRLSPGRLPSVRFSTSRSSEEPRVPFYGPATHLAPLSPDSIDSPPSRHEPPTRATPCSLGLPRGSPRWNSGKMLLTDFCNRRTTRAPEDCSITERAAFAAPTPRCLPPDRCEGRGPTSIRWLSPRGAGPPCGNPTPVGLTLDGAGPALVASGTVFRHVAFRRARRRTALSGWSPHRSVVFSDGAARTTSDAPCRSRRSRLPGAFEPGPPSPALLVK